MSKRNAEYWADRLSRQNQRIGDKTVEELETRLRQYYRAASADITKEAEGLYNKLLAEAGDQPVRPNDLYRLDRMYHLQSKIHKRLRELGGQEIEATGNKLREVAELVDKNTVSGLPDAAKNSPWAVLPREQAEAIANRIWCADGENWSDRIWKNKAALQQRLEKGMVDGIIRGVKTDELTKTLMADMGVGYREASRIARTETTHVQAEAEAAALEREGYERYRFVNATDGRTCDECGRLNGKTFRMSERRPGVNFPPIHPNCRGRIVAVVTFEDGTEVQPVGRRFKEQLGKRNKASVPVVQNEKSGIIKEGCETMNMAIQIDELTPCLVDSSTGDVIRTTFQKVTVQERKGLKRKGWLFNWTDSELDGDDIYKLTVAGEDEIQGLIALRYEERSQAVYAHIAESAPQNRGKDKKYKGVGGHLFAIAAQKSIERGYGGFVFLDAKNQELVQHYEEALGAVLVGMPHPYRMIIDEEAAAMLLKKYTL